MILFRDPIPTPAARAGRVAVLAGLAGWAILVSGFALLATSWQADDETLATSLRVTGGWVVGASIIAFLVGVIAGASGITKFIIGAPDPGRALVYTGLTLNALPMVLVALGAMYDRFSPMFKPPVPRPAIVGPATPEAD